MANDTWQMIMLRILKWGDFMNYWEKYSFK